MSDLTAKEQKAVRTALRFLRLCVGAWAPLAKALRCEPDTVHKVAAGRRGVTPALALRVARIAGVPMEELLAGRWLSAGSARTAVTRRMIRRRGHDGRVTGCRALQPPAKRIAVGGVRVRAPAPERTRISRSVMRQRGKAALGWRHA